VCVGGGGTQCCKVVTIPIFNVQNFFLNNKDKFILHKISR